MLTIFTTFRSFEDPHFDIIQRNSIQNWLQISTDILVMGDDGGSKEVCQEFGLQHVEVQLSSQGTPMFDDMVAKAEELGKYPVLASISGDILLPPETSEVVHCLLNKFPAFMAGARRNDAKITSLLDFTDPNWNQFETNPGPPGAGDIFIFTKGYYRQGIKPFVVGRGHCDNWLIWEAMQLGYCCDASKALKIIHQHHHYPNKSGVDTGVDVRHNQMLAAGNCSELDGANWFMEADRTFVRNERYPENGNSNTEV